MPEASSRANKQRQGKLSVLVDTSSLRHSNRSTKYDGFKINQATDIKQAKSKVRARALPSVLAVSNAAAPAYLVSTTSPPPTSIEEIQLVGIRCGIAPDDILVEKLLDGQQLAPSSED